MDIYRSRSAVIMAGKTGCDPAGQLTAAAYFQTPFSRRTRAELVVTDRAVGKHISNIFTKLGLPPSDSDHRRVRAVLAYLGS